MKVPGNPTETQLLGILSRVKQQWENVDGTRKIVAELGEGWTVTGTIDPGEVKPGDPCRFLGRWVEHPRWGWQFAFDMVWIELPTALDAQAAYLAKLCQGIGMSTARCLVEYYGSEAVRLLIEDPHKVVSDGMLREAVAMAANETLKGVCEPGMQAAHLEVFGILRGHGFYRTVGKAALRKWRQRAPQMIRRDPFLLLTSGFESCGFVRCDKLYSSLKLPQRRLKRQGLAAWNALRQRDGDTWMSLPDAMLAVRQAIGGVQPRERRALAMMLRAMWLDCRRDSQGCYWIAERQKAINERMVARKVLSMLEGDADWPEGPFQGLSDQQAEQIGQALKYRIAVLAGNPGTGKTYTAAAVLRAIVGRYGANAVAVAAPTGKAAVRITEKMRDAGLGLQATTLHRLIGIVEGARCKYDEHNPLKVRVLVVDEASMINTDIGASVLAACGQSTHLLLVGDQHQLPPIGHGAVLRDLIDAGVPTATLSEIHRNAGAIVHACAVIKDGKSPDLRQALDYWPKANLLHVNLDAGKGKKGGKDAAGEEDDDTAKAPSKQQQFLEAMNSVLDWVQARQADATAVEENAPLGADLIDDVQVICARNVTRKAFNLALQRRLNPVLPNEPRSTHPTFRLRDKVICLKNSWLARADTTGSAEPEYVANGDIGRVVGFRGQQMLVKLAGSGRTVAVPLPNRKGQDSADESASSPNSDSDEGESSYGGWDLAYVVTCHKYQGSECPVVIVLVEGAGKLGSREWIYTAISRARGLCVVVGDRQEVSRYVRNVTLPERKTLLAQMIRKEIPCT